MNAGSARHAACLRLHRTLDTGIDRIQRRRAADVQPVALLAAEAQIGDGFRDMNLAEQLAIGIVAAYAVLVRITPADRAPDAPVTVGAQSIRDAGLRHFREDFAVRCLSAR